MRFADGSAGDADYAAIGALYSKYRQPELSIAIRVCEALGEAQSVLNVGAGAGSYEPTGKLVTAVERSASMRARRPAHLSRALDAVAQHLPFQSGTFDASMATFTIHQWPDVVAGLKEMRRVTRGPIVLSELRPERGTAVLAQPIRARGPVHGSTAPSLDGIYPSDIGRTHRNSFGSNSPGL
jgi:SAM-dependent methyltransferase